VSKVKVYLVVDVYDHEVGVTVFRDAAAAAALFEAIIRSGYRFGPDLECFDDTTDGTYDGDYSAWDGISASAWDGIGGWSTEVYGANVR
jgi:hypothetical protein